MKPLPKWPSNLGKPVDPMDNVIRSRAQSILTGSDIGVCPPLSSEQARDVLNWYRPTQEAGRA